MNIKKKNKIDSVLKKIKNEKLINNGAHVDQEEGKNQPAICLFIDKLH